MRHALRAILSALLLAAPALVHSPAVAQQDSLSQQFDDVRTALGLGKTLPPQDYTDRPPIVVPPTYNLPPPGSGTSERLPVNDPDVANRLKARSDPRRPVPADDPGRSASGRAARAYLIDPPSGLRDPDSVAADITHDTGSSSEPARHPRVRKKKTSASATQ